MSKLQVREEYNKLNAWLKKPENFGNSMYMLLLVTILGLATKGLASAAVAIPLLVLHILLARPIKRGIRRVGAFIDWTEDAAKYTLGSGEKEDPPILKKAIKAADESD